MKQNLKKNVAAFNYDVSDNGGYLYTVNAPYSSVVSNKRITLETLAILEGIVNLNTVLDIGCGDGTFTGELAARFPEVEFTGFDPASQAVETASKKIRNCKFWVGDILDSSTFPNARYDVVILRGVIHHLPTQFDAIRNSLLLSDRVIIIEPNGNNPILKWIEKNSGYHIKHEEQSFSSIFLKHMCIANGLKVVRLDFIGFVPFFFPPFLSRVIYFCQPLLEKIPLLGRFFGAQTVILAEKPVEPASVRQREFA